MQDKNTISIFQGSTVEADTVHDFLAQQGIGSLIRNHMQESLDAGWVTAEAEHAAEVFVAVEDENRAIDLLNNLYSPQQGSAAPTTGGGAIIVPESNQSVGQTPEHDRNVGAQQEVNKPLNLPRIIQLPGTQNRPAAAQGLTSEERNMSEERHTTTPQPPLPPRI